ncbi:MAG: hypothetical protein F4039_00960 [Gammaproteobacteria bacterium]|nr:hypothetical protein [Gammaproteobacteria bacterium]MYF53447.1 hypothetical protein [Gammaproteobacteria bacterium]MYK42650.1 hypothetical protein [Gammaproteobacteria bacterium]
MHVNLVYAKPGDCNSVDIECTEGISVVEFVEFVTEHGLFPRIELQNRKFAVWNQQVESSHILCDGDRLEVLRPLVNKPQELRRRRATIQKNQ